MGKSKKIYQSLQTKNMKAKKENKGGPVSSSTINSTACTSSGIAVNTAESAVNCATSTVDRHHQEYYTPINSEISAEYFNYRNKSPLTPPSTVEKTKDTVDCFDYRGYEYPLQYPNVTFSH